MKKAYHIANKVSMRGSRSVDLSVSLKLYLLTFMHSIWINFELRLKIRKDCRVTPAHGTPTKLRVEKAVNAYNNTSSFAGSSKHTAWVI